MGAVSEREGGDDVEWVGKAVSAGAERVWAVNGAV